MWGPILIFLAGFFCLIIVGSFFLPSKIKFSKKRTIEAERKIVFACIDDLEKWKTWSQWSIENDPAIAITYGEITKGVGAMMFWKGKKMGSGKMEILRIEQNHLVELNIFFNSSGFHFLSWIELKSDGNLTHIDWKMQVQIKRFGIAKLIGILLPKWMGRDMEIALKILRLHCEKK